MRSVIEPSRPSSSSSLLFRLFAMSVVSLSSSCGSNLTSSPASMSLATINDDAPVLISISPARLLYPVTGGVQLKAGGSGFTSQSSLVFNGIQLRTIEESSTELWATLPASLVTQPGPVQLYVWDSSNHADKSNPVILQIGSQAAFNLTASPSTLSINQWNTGQSSILVEQVNGFAGAVALSASGLPPGVEASFSPAGDGKSIFALQPTDDLQPGVFTIIITGVSGNITATTSLTVSFAELPVRRSENGYCGADGRWTGPRYDGFAELPEACFYTALKSSLSPGNVVSLSPGGDLQAALIAAHCGDTIVLQAGVSFSLNSSALPAVGCDDQHWITVRTSAPDSALPPEQSRINPSYAGVASLPSRPPFTGGSTNVMAQILETSPAKPLIPGDHYRFIGIEITREQDGKVYNALIHTQTSEVIFDRTWIHGDPLDDTTHLVQIGPGSDHIAVIDSYLNDAHCTTAGGCIDSQAVSAHDGGVAIKIVNNFLEAASENILFGGGMASTVTTDIEIRLNHFFKPMSWNPDDPTFLGTKFIVKNNLEFKEGHRVLVEGNFLENTWGGFSQRGYSVLINAKNQESNEHTSLCPICFIADVTLRYNFVTHGSGAMAIGDGDTTAGGWAAGTYDLSVHDLIFDGMQYAECYGYGNFLTEIGSGYSATNPPPTTLNNVSINHLTVVNVGFLAPGTAATGFMVMSGPPADNPTDTPQITNLQWTNSIIDAGNSGAYPDGGGNDNCSVGHKTVADRLTACWTGTSFFTSNLLITDNVSRSLTFPDGNHASPTWDQVGFVNFNGGDGGQYLLAPTSPYKGSASDGTDPGADVISVMAPVPVVE
jgi:hypothetical protein